VSRPVTILLPGLHGTTELFDRFVDAAPIGLPLLRQPLPNEMPLGYSELAAWVCVQLPPDPVVLVAESFSGPLALLVADRCPRVVAIVLCESFVVPPAPRFLAKLPTLVWNWPPPVALVSAFLTGGDRALAEKIRSVVQGLRGDVIASRIAAALCVDVRAELERFSRPLLCLSAKRDWIVPARSAARIRALKPSAQFAVIDGPHMLLQTRSIEAWSYITPFIERAIELLTETSPD
jgi:pimeloyl-[acyl-carrier protein] methyl ester esterase